MIVIIRTLYLNYNRTYPLHLAIGRWMKLVATMLTVLQSPNALAQSRDLRPHTEYGTADGDLRCKYEFYHDQWSERDVKHGRYSEWAAGDRLAIDGWYFDGLQDSTWKYWYINGKLKEVSNWEAGNRHGKTTLYDKGGSIVSETNYKLGSNEGLQIIYHSNGKVKSVAQYHNGVWHGNVTTYSKKGIRKRILEYKEGRKVKTEPNHDPKESKKNSDQPEDSKERLTKPKEEVKRVPQKVSPNQTPIDPKAPKPKDRTSQVPAPANAGTSNKFQPWENNRSQSTTKKVQIP